MTVLKTRIKYVTTLAMIAALSACGGGGGGNSSSNPGGSSSSSGGTTDPTATPTPSPNSVRLNVTAGNLKGTLKLSWGGSEYLLDQKNTQGEFISDGGEHLELEISSPPFQVCTILETNVSDSGDSYTSKISCADPSIHYLDVEINNLKGELGVSWGENENAVFIQGQPFLSLSSTLADIATPEISSQPELQTCTGEFTNTSELNATFSINCSDAESENIVEIPSALPFPVSLRGTTNIQTVSDETAVSMPGSEIDGVSIDGHYGTQECELTKGDFSAELNSQKWQLTCREFTVHVKPGEGVALTFDDGEEYILEAGDFSPSMILPVSRYKKRLILSKEFGVKELVNDNGVMMWQDVEGLPSELSLEDYVSTSTATYVLYKDEMENVYSLFELDDAYEAPLVELFRTEEKEGEILYSAEISLSSFNADEISFSEIKGVDGNKTRHILAYSEGNAVRELTLPLENDNGYLAVGSHALNTPFVFQVNDTNEARTPDTSMDMFILGQATSDALITNLDTQLHAVNWPDDQGNLRTWALGKNLLESENKLELAELSVIQVGSGPKQLVWRPISGGTETEYEFMGTDGKLFVIAGSSDDHDHQIASMFNTNGQVNISELIATTGISETLRVQTSEQLIQLPNEGDNKTLRKVEPVNGWVLLFSGDNDAVGEIWISNGETDRTKRIEVNYSWENFQNYKLLFAGSGLALVETEAGDIKILDLKN